MIAVTAAHPHCEYNDAVVVTWADRSSGVVAALVCAGCGCEPTSAVVRPGSWAMEAHSRCDACDSTGVVLLDRVQAAELAWRAETLTWLTWDPAWLRTTAVAAGFQAAWSAVGLEWNIRPPQ